MCGIITLPRASGASPIASYWIQDASNVDFIIACKDGQRICKLQIERTEEGKAGQIPVLTLYMSDGSIINLPETEYDEAGIIAKLKDEFFRTAMNRNYIFNVATLDHFYPFLIYPYHVWYDELSDCRYSDLNGAVDRMKNETYTKAISHIQQKYTSEFVAHQVRCDWKKEDFRDIIAMYSRDHPINRFRDYLEGLKWDGKSRVATMFQDFLGATNDPEYLGEVARAWIVGAVARQYECIRHEVIPSLIGPQGVGKTSFFIRLGRDFYRSTQMAMDDDKKFRESINGGVIVELGEGKSIRRDIEATKEFLSRDRDQHRKSYDRDDDMLPRHFVFALTCNHPEFVNDQTGARRFYPIFCSDLRRRFDPRPDPTPELEAWVDQIWAEALYLYKHGTKPQVNPAITAKFISIQNSIIEFDPDLETIESSLDAMHPHVGDLTYYREICDDILMCPQGSAGSRDAKAIIAKWRNSTTAWKKCEYNISINGKKWGGGLVRVKEAPSQDDGKTDS